MGYKLDDKNIEFPSKHMSKIGTGKNGDVYKYRDMALKVFKENKDTPIDVETTEYLSKISTTRIILPKNLLFYNNAFRGYTHKLIDKKGTGKRLIMLPKTDLVQDIRVLESDVETLSNKQVLLSGVEKDNTIFNGNLYLIDPTGYRVLEDCDSEQLEKLNKYQLHLLLVSLITSELGKNNFSNRIQDNIKELLKMKDAHTNSSEFFSDIIGNNESVKEFVKKI